MNLFENIFDKFTKQAQPMPSFGTPQAPRTNSYVAPNVPYQQNIGTGFGTITQPNPINASLPMGIPEPVFQKDPSDELKKEFGFNDTDIEFLRQAKQEGYDSDMAFEYITKKKQQEKQNIYSGDPSVDNTFMNVVGGAVAEIPKVAGEVGSFLGKASQYMPANLLGTALEAGFTDKTYGQLREEQKAQAEQLATAGQAGKEFVQKYGAYNPESTGAKVGETITDIGSAFVGPNKAKILKEGTGFVKGILPKTLNLATEGALAGAKYDVATKGEITEEGVGYGAGGNLVFGAGAKLLGKGYNLIKGKTPEETLIAKLGQEKTKGIVKGKVVNVPVPEKGIIETVTMGVGRPNDPKVLAGRALTPTYAGKTSKQIVNTIADVEKNIRKLWEGIRTGKYKGDISTLEDAANTVVTNLERIGASIGNSIKGAVGKVKPSTETTKIIRSTLKNKIEKRSAAYTVLKNFLTDTSKGLSVQDAMKAKRVYQTEIGKLIRSGDAGTDSYSALVKGVQELSDNIDNIVINSKGGKKFLEEKSQYAHLKKIVSDIAKSASVEGRRSPQTFVEQLGMVESLMEGVKNPLSTAGRVFAKEIGELNTRGGAWKELIKIYDTEAIKAMKGKKPIVKPNSTTNAKQPRNIIKPSTKSDSDIPEGYFKNAFGEIVKNPSNKNGGFIRNPFAKPEPKRLFAGENSAQPPKSKTGWFKGADGKMRFEIDDSGAKFYDNAKVNKSGKALLGDIFRHDDLFNQYPETKSIIVKFNDTVEKGGGSYNPSTRTLTINGLELDPRTGEFLGGTKEAKSTLLHEIQHAIQEKEGFAKGGSAGRELQDWAYNEQSYVRKITKLLQEDLSKIESNPRLKKAFSLLDNEMTKENPNFSKIENEYKDVLKPYQNLSKDIARQKDMEKALDSNDYELYKNLAGEVEARNVQSRMNLTAKERTLKSPESTEDVPRAKQIIRMDSKGPAMSIKTPDSKLIEEARKYKSAEELDALTKKATELGKYDGSYDVTKGKKLYRGGSEDGVFWTDDIDIAKSFGDEGVAEKIITMKKPLDVRSKDIREYIKKNTDINIDDATSAYSRSLPEFKKLMKWAKENGYDGIIGKTSDNGLNFTGNEFVTLSPPKPLSPQKTAKQIIKK